MKVVDFHAYYQPESLLEELRQRGRYPYVRSTPHGEVVYSGPGAGRPIHSEQNDIRLRLEMMDEAGVDQQILRIQNVGGIDAFEADRARATARAVNEELAALAAEFPERFIPFAAVPAKTPDAAAEELRHAVKNLGHAGLGLSCRIDGKGIESDFFAPILETANALKLPLILLPNHPPLMNAFLDEQPWLAGAFGFQVDLTWSVLRLLHHRIPERYPDITFIVANLGGVLTSISERLDQYWERVHAGSDTLAHQPSKQLKNFFYETASAHPAAIAAAARILGADRLVFGSDYPSFDLARGVANVRDSGLTESEVRTILAGNAASIFTDRN